MMTENFENVNHLVLNFYPDGYSIAVKLNEFPVFTSETILETARISYEETSLLDYIENEELPPLLVEMIDSSPKLSQYKIWHNGCLILEVRDKIEPSDVSHGAGGDNDNNNDYNDPYSYRSQNAAKLVSQSSTRYEEYSLISNHKPPSSRRLINGEKTTDHDDYVMPSPKRLNDTSEIKTPKKNHFILLKPNNLSITYDVLNLTGSKHWSTQERLQLESQIVMHNSPRLSLDVDETMSIQSRKIDLVNNISGGSELPTDSSSRGYSKLTARQTPYKKPRLKDIYMNRLIHSSRIKSNGGNDNGGRNNGHQSRIYNLYNDHDGVRQHKNSHPDSAPIVESLPPELRLHQFVVARRKAKQKSLPIGPTPRFHRYKNRS